MELSALKNKIMQFFSGTPEELEAILQTATAEQAVFPFNEYEHLICSLMNKGYLSYEQYTDIRTEYISANPNLWIFEISAPRAFGEGFAQTYLRAKSSKLESPNKKLDPNYSGSYDLWLSGIRIEVKASRAVDSNSKEPLYMKALSHSTTCDFLMNFQQLKPQYCDVFVWLAVFRDNITIWVMSSKEVQNHADYSKGQHKGNLGNEGQLHITQKNIDSLNQYELKDGDDLEQAIRNAANR